MDHRRHGVRSPASLDGLFGWDGVFYRGIGEHGYRIDGIPSLRFFPLYPLVGRFVDWVSHIGAIPSLRFFPLYPLVGRFVDWVTHIGVGTALLVVANVSALVAAVLVHRLTRLEGGDGRAATRAAWLVALVPPAFVLSWAFSEALFVALAAATFLALRRERWWAAAALGFLTALTRPTGVFLALAAGFEAARGIRSRKVAELPPRLVATVAPVVGTATYLWWVGREFGDWRLPMRIQDDFRGRVVNPI